MLLHRVTDLFARHDSGPAYIISPYLTTHPLRCILKASQPQTPVNVVTSISDSIFLNGSSSVEAIRFLLSSTNVNLFSLERLHAKAYIAGNSALVGSANCTDRGLGISPIPNHELLVSISPASLEISALLLVIEEFATRVLPDSFERLLVSIEQTMPSTDNILASEISWTYSADPWLPSSHIDFVIDYLIHGSLYRIPVIFREDIKRDSEYIMLRVGDEKDLLNRSECLAYLRKVPIIRFLLANQVIEKYRIWRVFNLAGVAADGVDLLYEWICVLALELNN